MDIYTQIQIGIGVLYHIGVITWLYLLQKDVKHQQELVFKMQRMLAKANDTIHEFEHQLYLQKQQTKANTLNVKLKPKSVKKQK